MIIHVNGNLLEADEDLILHQVNAQGAMNSGVAKQIREKWNVVYTKYKEVCFKHSPNVLLGVSQYVPVSNKQIVVNLFGQQTYGYTGERFTNYEAIYKALEKVAKKSKEFNLSVALPYKMGCDRGGADWHIVLAMIESLFKDHTTIVAIYHLEAQSECTKVDMFDASTEYKPAFIESPLPNINPLYN